MGQNPVVWVVIAAYNEEETIGKVIRDLLRYPYRIIVVDDGSVDCTPQIASSFPITLLRHAINLGQGAALQTGFSYLLENENPDYVVTFDADGQHNPEDIGKLLGACRIEGCDVALGSRFINQGDAVNIPRNRRLTLKLAVLLTRLITGMKLTDTHNGLRSFTAKSLKHIQITQNGMSHASQLLSQIAKNKLSYIEVPVTISYTAYSMGKGQSIWNSINILWDIISGYIR